MPNPNLLLPFSQSKTSYTNQDNRCFPISWYTTVFCVPWEYVSLLIELYKNNILMGDLSKPNSTIVGRRKPRLGLVYHEIEKRLIFPSISWWITATCIYLNFLKRLSLAWITRAHLMWTWGLILCSRKHKRMTSDNKLIDLIDIWTELYYMTDNNIYELRHIYQFRFSCSIDCQICQTERAFLGWMESFSRVK